MRAYLFMLYSIEYGLDSTKLAALKLRLEESLRNSWKEEAVDKKEIFKIVGEGNEGLIEILNTADRLAPILAEAPSIQGNPRIVKRLLNVIRMRSNTARRRGMPFDENVIAKLVIFERCASASAVSDFYQMILKEDGRPKVLALLEDGELDIPVTAPDSWKDEHVSAFLLEWSKLAPKLSDKDLRGAIYLSRETATYGSFRPGLSDKAVEAFSILKNLKGGRTSRVAQQAISGLGSEEAHLIMDEIIDQLRQVDDWGKRPLGVDGMIVLATGFPETSQSARSFVNGLSDKPKWLTPLLKMTSW